MPPETNLFELQFLLDELPLLAGDYLKRRTRRSGFSYSTADTIAFCAGRKIKEGDRSKDNLKKIFAWKNSDDYRWWDKLERDFDKNTPDAIEKALTVAVEADDGVVAIKALTELYGVGVPTASAILATIHPERYTVIDQLALRGVGIDDPPIAF